MTNDPALPVLPDAYDEVYSRALASVGEHLSGTTPRLNAFWPQQGPDYDGELCLIGRAPNGQHKDTHFDVREATTESGRREILTRARNYGETRPGIGFPVRNSPDANDYEWDYKHVKRVRLFTVPDELVGLSRLCWSNLYKISPAETGNPSTLLRRVQRLHCIELLKFEMQQFQPRRVLIMSGFSAWFEEFEARLGLALSITPGTYLERTGVKDGVAWVVARHPMRASPAVYCTEVRAAFASLGASLS